jgi:hypothetical protein
MFNYAQHQSDTRLQASLDNEEYNEADLFTIKVPLSVAYQVDREDFERVDGEVNYLGKIYKYVKRKMVDGQLILLCLPDDNKMQLEAAKTDFFKNTNDLTQANHSKKTNHSKAGIFKNLLGDYVTNTSDHTTALQILPQTHRVLKHLDQLPTSPHNSPEQPPDFI